MGNCLKKSKQKDQAEGKGMTQLYAFPTAQNLETMLYQY